jgi:hypothetical protein
MIESLEPGHIAKLPPGKTITFAQPPRVQDGTFSVRSLRRIAVGVNVTYEDLTGDYSQVNFSSARIARLRHWAGVNKWRWRMLIPQLCDRVWLWVMQSAADLEGWPEVPRAEWSAPPMPILEPDKEGLAYQRLLRVGAKTWPQMVRELGEDPQTQLDEIENFNKEIDRRGIVLDSDPRKTTAAGQQQMTAPAGKPAPAAKPPAEGDADQGDEKPPEDAANDSPAAADPTADAPHAPDETTAADKEKPVKKPTEEVRVFAYHQPFMKAKEIREGIGLDGDVEDGELFAGEFLAKHGGKPDDPSDA